MNDPGFALKNPPRRGRNLLAALMAIFLGATITARAGLLSFDPKGVHIDGGAAGAVTLDYPTLDNGKVTGSTVAGNTSTVTYDTGGTLTVQISGGDITYTFANAPAGATEVRFDMLVPLTYQQGGKWQMDQGAVTTFSPDMPPDPHLFQSHAWVFTLTNGAGKSLVFHTPVLSYLKLQDNRKWNWATYQWFDHIPFKAGGLIYKFSVTTSGM
jgi:hypothetical protein